MVGTAQERLCPPYDCNKLRFEPCHDDFIVMGTIQKNRSSLDTLFYKSTLPVKGNRRRVCCKYSQLDSLKPERVCRKNCVSQQPFAKPLASVFRQKAHEEIADVSGNRSTGGRHIAPSNNQVAYQGNDLRIAMLDIALNESAHLFERGRLQEGKVPVFSSNDVDGSTKTFRIIHSDLADLNGHSAISLRLPPTVSRLDRWWAWHRSAFAHPTIFLLTPSRTARRSGCASPAMSAPAGSWSA